MQKKLIKPIIEIQVWKILVEHGYHVSRNRFSFFAYCKTKQMQVSVYNCMQCVDYFNCEVARNIFAITDKDNWVMCPKCKEIMLDPFIVSIINDLKRENLLDKDYKLLCCKCYSDEQEGEMI